MAKKLKKQQIGFTLVEVLIALLILSAMALMSYRGLNTVLDTRDHVAMEEKKWKTLSSFFVRFQSDVQLAAPYMLQTGKGNATAWRGKSYPIVDPQLEFSRFSATEGSDTIRRIAYRLNEKQEIELWIWPDLDLAPDALPTRYSVLRDVRIFELQYLTPNLSWVDHWPISTINTSTPEAVQLHIVLDSGENIVRIFSL